MGGVFAAGELAMTAKDLAIWDQALLEGKILKPASMMEFTKTARLTNEKSRKLLALVERNIDPTVLLW